MRRSLIVAVLMLNVAAAAQEAVTDTSGWEYKNMFGIDVSFVYRQFFSRQNSRSPYLFSYRRIEDKNALRGLLGGGSYAYEDSLTGKRRWTSAALAIGYERHAPLGERWLFYYGADAVMHYSTDIFVSTAATAPTSRRNDYAFRWGAAPLLGLAFGFNNRLSLSVESSYAFLFVRGRAENSSIPAGNNDQFSRYTDFEMRFFPPYGLSLRLLL